MIKNILEDRLFYSKRAKNGGNDMNQNHSNNTLLYLDAGQLWALDLNKILTSVPELQKKNTFSVQYRKDTLILSNLNFILSNINITISDISGRIVRKLDSPVSNSELRIPLRLPKGTYLVHIQDGNKEYTAKFLVME
jgi:hypothetical protein